MLDYLFLDPNIAHTFAERANQLSSKVIQETTPEGGVQVRVDEESLADDDREQLEDWYDELFFGVQADAIQQQDAGVEACGVQIRLASGEFTTVLLAPTLMGKLLSILEASEIQALFNQIADAVEKPQSMTVCHAMQCAMIDTNSSDV